MFLHIKSPARREKVTDLLINIQSIEFLDILKVKRDGEIFFKVEIGGQHCKGCEIHTTLESAQNRIKEIMMMTGETEENATRISQDFLPDDKSDEQDKKEAVLETLNSLKKIASNL